MPSLLYSGNTPSGWVRPVDWLSMPYVTASDQVFYGLIAVFNSTANYMALTATGNYTIDWGDGSATENINSGVTAQHLYDYSTLSSATLCSRGYKQAIIKIIPQSGQSLLSVDTNKKHSAVISSSNLSPLLDIVCSCAASSTLGLTVGSSSTATPVYLESVYIFNGQNRLSTTNMFYQARSLANVNAFSCAAVTSANGMYQSCYAMKGNFLPHHQFGSVLNISSMFSNGGTWGEMPLYNFSTATNIDGIFSGSYVASLPAYNFSAVTSSISAGTFGVAGLAIANFTGLGVTFSVANLNLSAAAINTLFTNLPTVTSKTVTVTGNPGAATCTTSIATTKGWTVVT